jgi:hypothetical protein
MACTGHNHNQVPILAEIYTGFPDNNHDLNQVIILADTRIIIIQILA